MLDVTRSISTALIELRDASLTCDGNPHDISRKYDMLFYGSGFNTIYSNELTHALSNYFGISVSHDELNKMLPSICRALGMGCIPMQAISNPGPTAAHCIVLYGDHQ